METLIAFIDKAAIPIAVIMITLESLLSAKENLGLYNRKDTISNIGSGLLGLVIGLFTKYGAFRLFSWIHLHGIREGGFSWGELLLAILLHEFIFYFYHRFAHEVRFFWAGHITHHSSQKYNFSTALRIPFHNLYRWGFWIPMAFFVNPILIILADSISLTYQFFLHTELRLWKTPKWFSFFFNTATFHSVHHASNPKYLDKNYGGMLIIFDRIFGTFQEEEEKPVYGVPESKNYYNPIMMGMEGWIDLFKGLRKLRNLSAMIVYLAEKPGAGYNKINWAKEGKSRNVPLPGQGEFLADGKKERSFKGKNRIASPQPAPGAL